MAWSSDEDSQPELTRSAALAPTLSDPKSSPKTPNLSSKLSAEYFLRQASPAPQRASPSENSNSDSDSETETHCSPTKQNPNLTSNRSPKTLVESWLRETTEAARREKIKRKRLLSDSDSSTDADNDNPKNAPQHKENGQNEGSNGSSPAATTGNAAATNAENSCKPLEPNARRVAVEDEDDEDEVVWPKLESSTTAIDSQENNVALKLEPDLYGKQHEVSGSVNRWLRDYQRHGVQWIWKRIARNRGCILQDDMGLGKTGM